MIKAIVTGRVTKKFELNTTGNGTNYVRFAIASNEGKEKTTFLNVIAFASTAEFLAKYCNEKGKRIGAELTIDNDTYRDSTGKTQHGYSFVVKEVWFL